MIGTNKLTLNHATMCGAVEHWLKSTQLAEGIDAKVVKIEASNYSTTFEVAIDTPETPTPEGKSA